MKKIYLYFITGVVHQLDGGTDMFSGYYYSKELLGNPKLPGNIYKFNEGAKKHFADKRKTGEYLFTTIVTDADFVDETEWNETKYNSDKNSYDLDSIRISLH